MNRILYFLLPLSLLFTIHANSKNALAFDGINDYTEINSLANDMAGRTVFTVEFWMLANKDNQTSSIRVGLFAINEPATAGDNTFILSMGGLHAQDGKLVVFDVVTGFDIISTTMVGDNTCHHIAYVRNGIIGTLYIDGVLENTHYADYTIGSSNRYSLGQEWDISTPSDFYNGKLEDLRVWSTARTIAEINQNMHNELFGSETGLLAYYTFNQGSANNPNPGLTTLQDFSLNGNNGTLNNFALTGSTSNWTNFCVALSAPQAINETEAEQIFGVFPVPATDKLTVHGNFEQEIEVMILDISGRVIRTKFISGTISEINIADLAPGIYFLRAKNTTVRFQKI